MLRPGSEGLVCCATGTGNLNEALQGIDTSTFAFQENNYQQYRGWNETGGRQLKNTDALTV